MNRLPFGKIDPKILDDHVLNRLPNPCERLVVGPSVGEDSAVIDLGGLDDAYMVVSSDPISGAEEKIGRYAVHVNANDVATAGARPSLFLCNIMMSESASTRVLDTIFSQISEECAGLGVTIAGGHTEVSPIQRTIISSTMIGFVSKNRLARRSVNRGDVILLTKGSGIEGTSIIGAKRGPELAPVLGADLIERAKDFSSMLSVVPEAMIAADEGVKRMHDPTEGGVLGGLMEMCVANKISARVYSDRIPIPPETEAICRELGIDPLKLISSGSLLCIFPATAVEKAKRRFKAAGIPSSEIGLVEDAGEAKLTLATDSGEEILREFPMDEIWGVVV